MRTREEQITDLGSRIFVGMRNHTDSMCEAQRHIDEAEARGAEEQRRKDGEGQEPYAWGDVTFMMKDHPFAAYLKPPNADPKFNIPLYAHPANVAALEARVKQLEGENAALKISVMKAAESVMGIETPCMKGDNLAVTICSYFEDLEGEPCDNGWHEGATNAYEEIKSAIIKHFREALTREGTPS